MDLSERRSHHDQARHPWELARARAVLSVLRQAGVPDEARILDVGCGDGYTGKCVHQALRARELVGLDTQLDATTRAALAAPGQRFVSDPRELDGRFDVLLFLDVIEHVADDADLLASTVAAHAAPDACVLVTVPAFQVLFTRHDSALKHHRRYDLHRLHDTLTRAGLERRASGYLFASLLLPRALARVAELIPMRRPAADAAASGLATWSDRGTLTRALVALLDLDNRVLLNLSRRNLTLPGLSAWAFCRPRPS